MSGPNETAQSVFCLARGGFGFDLALISAAHKTTMDQLQHRYEGGVSQLCDIFRDIGAWLAA